MDLEVNSLQPQSALAFQVKPELWWDVPRQELKTQSYLTYFTEVNLMTPGFVQAYEAKNLTCLCKHQVAALQLQSALKEVSYMEPWQLGFRSGYNRETALVALVDDLWSDQLQRNATLLHLWSFSSFQYHKTRYHWHHLQAIGLGSSVYQ